MANKSEKLGKLISAVNKVMLAVDGIEKNSSVGKGQNSYKAVKDMDVKLAFKNEMANNGLCIFQIDIDEKTKINIWDEIDSWSKQDPKPTKRKQSVFTKAKVTYLLCHTSEEWIELRGFGFGIDAQDKGAGKVTTYALKNLLMYTFLAPSGDIDDSDNHHSDEAPQKKAYLTESEYNSLLLPANKKNIQAYLDAREVKAEWRKTLENVLIGKSETKKEVPVKKTETKKKTLPKLVKDSADWEGIVKYINDGKLKDLNKITKFKVSVALKKELQTLIVAKNPELEDKGRPDAIGSAEFEKVKKGTKEEITNALSSYRMADEQRKELEAILKKTD